MHRFVPGRSFAVLFAPILLSMLAFNRLKKKKKSAEKESTKGASAPFFCPEGAYDVFLSFKGSDTRKGFADHLYRSLLNAGTMRICVFRDDDSLPIGEEFGSQLLDAITRSKISIPIISENYASSKWCLRELVRIMDCKKNMAHIVLPIFYKVDPSDVRYRKGNFGKAFDSRKKHFDENDIQEGRRALEEVSYLKGWESEKVANGLEGELVEKVIKTVMSKLRPDFHLDVTKRLVGFGDHAKKIRNWLDTSASNAQMIGIYGMGGIGKTTLAKIIYNELSNDFVYCSFLPDIRETAHQKGITYLQKKLIKGIRLIEDEVSTVDDGKGLIKATFKEKKVLILLDDVDDKVHLNALAGQCNWFTSRSIIIVTTRNKSVLDQSEFEVGYKYKLNEIDMKQSLILFNSHAFREDYSLKNVGDITKDIISTLGGLPLALEVIGSYLYKKSRNVWVDMLRQLKEKSHGDVQKILKISYDALDDNEKEIFLDIARFYIGKESKFTIYIWEDHGVYANKAIEELELRCLIKIGDDGILWMHDQLRDLGRSIWQEKEASKVLMEEKSSRFLRLKGAAWSGDFPELRWLQWLDIEPNLSLWTTNLPLSRLVVLQLSYNQIKEDWRGWTSIMAARQLKVLDLACCEYLRCTPDLSVFIKLEILILKGCQRLERVHPSIGQVKNLVSLDLSGCGSLKELPGQVDELEKLKELILDSTGITKIPTSIDSLNKLEKLSARACRSLREIPSSIWDLQNLHHLDISESVVEKLPGVIERSEKPDVMTFTELDIILKDCCRLEQVHHSIGKVKSLVSLDLSGCGSLEELPEEVGELEGLKELILDSTGIAKIPMSIHSLSKLEKLSARACRSLREISSSIWYLQNLQYLDISESAIEKLPGVIGRLKEPDLMAFTKLKVILKDCYGLERVHFSIGKVKSLVSLDLSGCGSLKELPGEVGELEELKELILDSTGMIEIPSSIGFLTKLEKMSARACRSLREIPSTIGDLQNLQHLDFSDSAIEKLPRAIGRLKKLRRLCLESCCSLNGEIPSEIGDLSSLEILQLSGASISDLPESIQNLSSLQHLSLEGCHKLRSLPKLPSGLKFLEISSRSPRLPQGFCPIHLEALHVSWTRSWSS